MDIVIVEDSEIVVDGLWRMLASLPGARIVGTARREEEAVGIITDLRPDVVTLDMGLASGSGLGVLKRIRALGCGARVLVLTHNVDEAYRQACLEAGADGFYDKGGGLSALFRRLEDWIPPMPANEGRRLRALRRLRLLDTPAEEVFDEITRLCAELLDMPIALVSLVDERRQWFKSRVGLDARETSRAVSFCGHAINHSDTFIVEDATRDPRFADNPLVRGPWHLRFYAGVPLTLTGGEAVGTLCVIDRVPRQLGALQKTLLEVLARKIVTELELRQRVGALEEEIAHRRDMEVRIMHLATRDPLTGLPNRAALIDRLRQGIKVAERDGHMLAFFFLDLDRFKLINDTLGHPVGDGLLQRVGKRLTELLRDSDTIARLGGDEFAVILPKVGSVEDAQSVGGKILEVLREPMQIGGHLLRADCGVGLALYPVHGDSDELLIRHADLALYEAKRSGVHQWRMFEPAMNDAAVRRVTLEGELRDALAGNELALHYQPQVSLENGHLTGMEVLVRWRHPQRGLLSPTQFISLAEETGLIWELGRQVMETACAQWAAWRAKGIRVPRLAVNVSPAQLRPELVGQVRDCMIRHGIGEGVLELEITESALTADGPQVLKLLNTLTDMGVGIAVDDFGVGYSSLALLRRLPLGCLKVDKSFIDEMTTSHQDITIVEAVLRMGHGLGLRTVAEGVETPEQRDALRMLGCQYAQGYLISRPLSAADFEVWLADTAHRSRTARSG